MSEKAVDTSAQRQGPASAPQQPAPPLKTTPSHDDGITNPRDGRGPLRPRDDQSAKLPLRPPH